MTMPGGSPTSFAVRANDDNGHNHDDSITTPLLKKTASHTDSLLNQISLLFSDWFLWELLSVFVAVLALVPIVSILAVYDSSSLPDWPSVFTVGCFSFPSSDLGLY